MGTRIGVKFSQNKLHGLNCHHQKKNRTALVGVCASEKWRSKDKITENPEPRAYSRIQIKWDTLP